MLFRIVPALLLLCVWTSAQTTPAAAVATKAPMAAEWKMLPEVNGNTVNGSLLVADLGDDDFDQTILIEAVSENGKAFVIGYQHFNLRHHALSEPIPFQSNLPPGRYVIHADAIAEVAARKTIYRLHMQSPNPLVITVI
jgi:hypothetical protein